MCNLNCVAVETLLTINGNTDQVLQPQGSRDAGDATLTCESRIGISVDQHAVQHERTPWFPTGPGCWLFSLWHLALQRFEEVLHELL